MMKKIYIYFMISLMIGLYQACSPDTDPLFDKSADERMNETLQNYKELLVSASNGWLVEYYPHSSRSYGGFNLFFNFTDEDVTVKSEISSQITTVEEATSSYTLGQDMGPTLNFDIYNKILNYFSDPIIADGGGVGFGFEGDYEFVFMSGNENELILRGKKTKNTIRLVPIASTTWDEYLDDVLNIKEAFAAPAYSITVNGEKLLSISKTSSAYNHFNITYKEEGKEDPVTVSMPYIVTSKGIKSYEPLTINGITFQDFVFNNETQEMISTEGDVTIKMEFPPVEEVFVNSLSSTQWFLSSSSMGDGFLPMFNAMKSGIEAFGEQLNYAWIGMSVDIDNPKPSFSFGCFDGTQIWFGSNLLNIIKVNGSEGQIKIEVTGEFQINGDFYSENVPELWNFTLFLAGEYKITTSDPLSNITTVTLTDTSNPNKTFSLTLEPISFP